MITLTIFLVAAVTIFGFWHYLYQAYILRIIQEKLCFNLFGLHDELRRVKLNEGDRFDDNLFNEVQSFLNGAIAKLPRLGIVALIRAHIAIKADKELWEQANALTRKVEDCAIPDVRKIYMSSVGLALVGILANSGGWIPTVVPVLAVMYFWNEMRKIAPTLLFASEATKASAVRMAH